MYLSEQCGIGIVDHEIHMLKVGLQCHPHAKWVTGIVRRVISLTFCSQNDYHSPRCFFLVSGDSIPTKPPEYLVNFDLQHSLTGAGTCDGILSMVTHFGHQWLLVTRVDAENLVVKWLIARPDWKAAHLSNLCQHGQPTDSPDEEMLQSILHTKMKVPINGHTPMEESNECTPYRCSC